MLGGNLHPGQRVSLYSEIYSEFSISGTVPQASLAKGCNRHINRCGNQHRDRGRGAGRSAPLELRQGLFGQTQGQLVGR